MAGEGQQSPDGKPTPGAAVPPDVAGAAGLKSRFSVQRIFKALGYSRQGLVATWRHEAAFRQEVLAAIALAPLAAWLADDPAEFAILMAALVLVLLVELLNSAIEALADAVSMELRPLLGRAKDVGSAAVLLSMVVAALVWFATLYR